MVRAVQLHHRPEAGFAFPPLPVRLLAPTHRVLACRHAPAPQRLVIHHQLGLGQLLGHQRRTEVRVAFLPIQGQHFLPQCGGLAPRAGLAPQPVHKARISVGLIPLPDAVALAVAHPHQFRRLHHC